MKHFNFWALALTAITLAACTSEDDILTQSPPSVIEETEAPIVFSSSQSAFTRADFTGAEAAAKLGKAFVVTGFKGSETKTPGSIVFDNYLVEYTENTANTTESNSSNWEYVGKGRIKHAIDNGITQQAIKYWDYTQTQYDFFGWSTGEKTAIYEGTPTDNQVLVTNIQPNSKTKTWTAAGTGDDPDPACIAYTFTGKAEDLAQCYISDLVTVNKSDAKGYGEETGYNQTVTLKFRQLGTKVRIGIYETVPGYSVKNVKFYTKGGLLTKTGEALDADQIVDKATIFSAGADIYKEGTYKIYFPTMDTPDNADNNQAHIKFTPKTGATQATTVEWGTMNYTYRESGEKDNGAVYLGRASNDASYAGDAANNYYEIYLPNETGTNLNLRVDFTLESIDGSGEIIEVKNAKAQVPSIYTTWKPGFAYTYLFKISDKTNGRTGVYDPTQADDATINSDPAGLYPITFDALVVNAEDGDNTQETITTIATPSITTYQNGSKVVNNDEYTVITPDASKGITGDIYVTVNEGDNVVTLKDKAALYTIPDGSTEAEVVDALQMRDDDPGDYTIKGRSGMGLTEATLKLIGRVNYGVDGNSIIVGGNKVSYFTPVEHKTYAFVYTKTAATGAGTVFYEARAFDNFESGETKYRYDYKATEKSHTVGSTGYFDAQKGHVYFKKTGSEEPYTYTKIAKPFIGQGATNLFTRSGDAEPYTYTKAITPYAQSGVTYYYTTNGQDHPEAHLVSYATDMLPGGLYEKSGDDYIATADTEPADGKAYYYLDGTVYKYCVFLPQSVEGMFELDTTKYVVASETSGVDGQTYFDKYTKNNGEYYVKVIKVQ